MSLRDKIKALQEELVGLAGVQIVIFPPGVAVSTVDGKAPSEEPEPNDMNFDGGGEDETPQTFGVNSLGLPAKIMKLLEEHGYETIPELSDAVDDGTFEELKGITAAILKRVKSSLDEFKANHPESGADEAGSGDEDDGNWKKNERCQVRIDGDWYPGTVQEININDEKVHIVFDDGDKDWYPVNEVETLPNEE